MFFFCFFFVCFFHDRIALMSENRRFDVISNVRERQNIKSEYHICRTGKRNGNFLNLSKNKSLDEGSCRQPSPKCILLIEKLIIQSLTIQNIFVPSS